MMKVYLPFLILFLISTLFTNSITLAQMSMDCGAGMTDPSMHAEQCEVLALVPVDNATYIAVNNGSWFNASTWNVGAVPAAGANVLIDSGVVVTYNGVSNINIHWVRVNGTLNFATNINTQLKVNTFVVDPEGIVNIGTEATPVQSTVTAQILFADEGPIDIVWDPYFFSKGFVSLGSLTTYGAYKKAYCSVKTNLSAGATSIKLYESPDGWKVGDQLILAGTNTDRGGSDADNSRFHDEELTITSIAGKTIYFTNNLTGGNSLLYEHSTPAGYGLKYYIANITRNIKFETENFQTVPISQRGHFMLMHNTNQNISYTAFYGLGRTDKNSSVTDPVVDSSYELISGGENVRGRYACHVHHAGTNDALTDPVNIKGSAVYDTPGWGFVSHSSNAVIEDNIVYQYRGSAFVTEEGNELGAFRRNFAIKGTGQTTEYELSLDSRVANFDLGYGGVGFWMQTGNVEYENNIVASTMGEAYVLFTDDNNMPDAHREMIPVSNLISPVIAGTNDSIPSSIIPIRKNTGSIAYNCSKGMLFWTHLFNDDNVGNFSMAANQNYAHNAFSLLDNFKFWGLLNGGIVINYSNQVYFRNGLLLGDLTDQYLEVAEGEEKVGYAFTENTFTGQVIYDNLTVKGWQKAIVAFRIDDRNVLDDNEYNYKSSKIIGGIYDKNLFNIIPEEGTNAAFIPGYFQYPKYFQITGSPSFTSITSNVLPVADFTYAAKGGTSVQMNGILSSDADASLITGGNGIAAYTWNFGDGKTGYGADVVHYYNTAGTYSVTLTVYDAQGQTNSITKTVYVSNVNYSNAVINSGFEIAPVAFSSTLTSTDRFANKGWFSKADWFTQSGKELINKSENWNRPLFQVVRNDTAMRGNVQFSFQAKNTGTGATGNSLRAEVYGINGEFNDADITLFDNISKWYSNDATFESTLLLNEDFGLAAYDWQTFKRNLDLGNGYQFIVIKFYSNGVKTAASELQGIDNVCLPCVCTIPAGQLEDQLTSNHVMLIWDNVGSDQYQLQFKKTGAAWSTYTVNNTYNEFNTLLPNTTYQWRVQALCDGVWTSYSTIRNFITPAAGSLCTSPSATSVSLITNNSATLNWENIPGALQYQLSYKKITGGTWTNKYSATNLYALTGLSAGTLYQWKVRSQCTEGWKDYTFTSVFTTLALREGDTTEMNNELSVDFYPNPARNELNMVINSTESTTFDIRITDMIGNIVLEKQANVYAGMNQLQMNVSKLSKGAYILQVMDSHKFIENKKLIIE